MVEASGPSGSAGGSAGGKAAPVRRRPSLRRSLDADEFINELDPISHQSRAHSTREPGQRCEYKNRELGEAQHEIKLLRLSHQAREKAYEEVFAFYPLEFKWLSRSQSVLQELVQIG